jgi:hypothetical protein
MADGALLPNNTSTSDIERSTELLTFLKSYTPSVSARPSKDILPVQFKLQIDRPLPEWNAPSAPAYVVINESAPDVAYHGLILKSGLPIRQKAIQFFRDFKHPNCMTLVAAGTCEIPSFKEIRFVLVYETPQKAKTLAAWMREKKHPFSERVIATDVVAPLNDLIRRMEEAGISHGRINLDNLYYNDHLIIGDCLSEVCGFSQPFLFEPVERATAMPLGKGESDANGDCFALGMVALHLTTSSTSLTQKTEAEHIEQVMQQGTYNTLTRDRELPASLQDLFRGTLNDKIAERWSPKLIQSWLDGKRFNLIPPSPPRDASRSFPFLNGDYANCRALAHALHQNWEQSPEIFKEGKLSRWLELSLHKPDLADLLNKLVNSLGGETTRNPKQMNEMITRAIILLDKDGPIRTQTLSVRIEGIGPIMADLLNNKNQLELNQIASIIENDVPNFWADLHRDELSSYTSWVLWCLQKIRLSLRQTNIGSGMERCLYDLNPSLSCQSPLLIKNHVMDVPNLLIQLDAIAATNAKDSEAVDRHIAAFIYSKMDIQREIKVHELSHLPYLANQSKLIALKLLIHAQEKTGLLKLKGLSAWVGQRLLPLLDQIHNRKLRNGIEQQLIRVSQSGDLRQIANVILNPNAFSNDATRFEEAVYIYQYYGKRIEEFKSDDVLLSQATRLGYLAAQLIALTICLGVIAFNINTYLL